MKGYGIYVKNDLLEPKHYKAMGQAVWLYLWLLDKMTSVSEQGTGKVLGGSPIKLATIVTDLPMSDRSYTRHVERLESNGYVTVLRTPYGYVFTVLKAKKKFGRDMERTVKVAPRTVKVAGENRTCGGNKEDSTEDSTSDNTEPSSDELKDKDNTMTTGWNNKGDDYEEGVVDYDSGELTRPEDEQKLADKELNSKIKYNLSLVEEMRGLPFGKGKDLNYHIKIYREMLKNGWTHERLIDALIEVINSDHWKEQKKVGQYPGMNTIQFHLRNTKPS